MATYKYKIADPGNEAYIYVNYNIAPDYDRPIYDGDQITVNGSFVCKDYNVHHISCCLFRIGDDSDWYDMSNRWEANVSVSAGKAYNFTAKFTVDSSMYEGARNARGIQVGLAIGLDELNPDEGFGQNTSLDSAGDQQYPFYFYRLSPQIFAMDFERAAADGKWADDGQYLQCKTLKIAKNSQAVLGDFAKNSIVCTGSDGSSRSVSLTQAQFAAALTPDGYSETKPGIFADFVSALGVDYTLTLTLGDDYEQATFTDAVMRSFARLHLSGAKGGGVAVGMFSTSTDDVPKFEVADTHESHFYGPLFCEGLPKGAMVPISFFGVYVVANSIAAKGHKTGSTTFGAVEGADGYAVMGAIGLSRFGVPSSATGEIAKISGRTLTAVLYNSDTSTTRNIGALFIVMAYKKLNNITSAASDPVLPAGPEIFDDGPYENPGLARADYIAMMAGIEIPADVEAAGDVQADAGGMEPPGIEVEAPRSAKFDTVKLYRDAGVWSAAMVRNAVGKWITADEAEEILNNKEGETHDSQ